MQPLSASLESVIHPRVLDALRVYRETGVLDWTPPAGTPDAITSEPVCPVCLDAGELAIRVPESVIARYVDCVACAIKATRRRERMLSGIDAEFRTATFVGYRQAARSEEARSIGDKVKMGALSGYSVLLWGPAGSLKTTLLTSAYVYLINDGMVQTAEWIGTADLLEAIRRGYDRESRAVEAPILDRASTCDLLMLDGLGEQNINDRNAAWIQEQIYRVIDRRLSAGRQTFITSNLDPAGALVKQLGSAIVSRLFGLCLPLVLHLDQGVDFRTVRRS
jgi:DNA replication protein DnaC